MASSAGVPACIRSFTAWKMDSIAAPLIIRKYRVYFSRPSARQPDRRVGMGISHFSPGGEVFKEHHVQVFDEIFSQFLDRDVQFFCNLPDQAVMSLSNEDPVFLGDKIFFIEVSGHRTPPYFSTP